LRVLLAFRSFFALLFKGRLSEQLIEDLGLTRKPDKPAAPPPPPVRESDGALQILAILQRDAQLIDFLMADISGLPDEQIGAVTRQVQPNCQKTLQQYVKVEPVIDGVEGSRTSPPAGAPPETVKFVGNVGAGKPDRGLLRHKGWRAVNVNLPPVNPRQDNSIIAPAEIEVE
jgi:hypothetical protein